MEVVDYDLLTPVSSGCGVNSKARAMTAVIDKRGTAGTGGALPDTPCSLSTFFFQAEDGIRVFHVTGVQTCALPIYRQGRMAGGPPVRPPRRPGVRGLEGVRRMGGTRAGVETRDNSIRINFTYEGKARKRSEERRVGKERRPIQVAILQYAALMRHIE